MYTIMQGEIEEAAVEYTDEFKKEMDRRIADYKSGAEEVVTAAESKKRIQKILKGSCK